MSRKTEDKYEKWGLKINNKKQNTWVQTLWMNWRSIATKQKNVKLQVSGIKRTI
jgi:hypothetical protein